MSTDRATVPTTAEGSPHDAVRDDTPATPKVEYHPPFGFRVPYTLERTEPEAGPAEVMPVPSRDQSFTSARRKLRTLTKVVMIGWSILAALVTWGSMDDITSGGPWTWLHLTIAWMVLNVGTWAMLVIYWAYALVEKAFLSVRHAGRIARKRKKHAVARAEYVTYLEALAAADAERSAELTVIRQAEQDQLDEDLPRAVCEKQVHGEPGRGLSVARFGKRAALGREGELRTAAALQPVLDEYPAARLIHGLRWPGTDHADIDHVLVVDQTVILVDSKMWRAGQYWWNGRQLFREGDELDAPALALAAGALEDELGATVDQVRAVVAIHSQGAVSVEDNAAPGAVRMVTGDELARTVRGFLHETCTHRVDRHLLYRLLQLRLPD